MASINPALDQLSRNRTNPFAQRQNYGSGRMDGMANLAYARTNGQKKILGAPGNVNAYSDINGVRYFFNSADMDRVMKDNAVIDSGELDSLRSRVKRGDRLSDEEWMRHLWLDPLNKGSHDVYKTTSVSARPVIYSN